MRVTDHANTFLLGGKKVFFIPIPKTATTSFVQAFCGDGDKLHREAWACPKEMEAADLHFSNVRDPLQRAKSIYYWLRNTKEDAAHPIFFSLSQWCNAVSLSEFWETCNPERLATRVQLFHPQRRFLQISETDTRIDSRIHIFDFANLGKAWDFIQKETGIACDLPWENKSSGVGKDDFSDAALANIQKFYAGDFALRRDLGFSV